MHQLLDYVDTQDNVVLTYHVSKMKLAAHSDISYLSEPKGRSRAGHYSFLSNGVCISPNNGPLLNIAHITKHAMSSTTKAELAELYPLWHERQDTYGLSSGKWNIPNHINRYKQTARLGIPLMAGR